MKREGTYAAREVFSPPFALTDWYTDVSFPQYSRREVVQYPRVEGGNTNLYLRVTITAPNGVVHLQLDHLVGPAHLHRYHTWVLEYGQGLRYMEWRMLALVSHIEN